MGISMHLIKRKEATMLDAPVAFMETIFLYYERKVKFSPNGEDIIRKHPSGFKGWNINGMGILCR
jgi:hypothetical protein